MACFNNYSYTLPNSSPSLSALPGLLKRVHGEDGVTVQAGATETTLEVQSVADADFVRMMPPVVRLTDAESKAVNAELVALILRRISLGGLRTALVETRFSSIFGQAEVGTAVRSLPCVTHALDLCDGSFVFAVDGSGRWLFRAGPRGCTDFTASVPGFRFKSGFLPIFAPVPTRLNELFEAWHKRGCTGLVLDGTHPAPLDSDGKVLRVQGDVMCDGCGVAPVVGIRWKCTVCPPSYDLCQACKDSGQHHTEHVLEAVE